MKFTDVIIPGDKIDIKLLHEEHQEENGGEAAKVYQSAVSDIFSEKECEILMPTNGGRMVLFQLERACSLVFFTKGGMYQCTAVVKGRYRKDNLYLLRVLLTSGLSRFQRREFFRIPCSLPLKYYHISDETAALPTTEKLFAAVQTPEYLGAAREGTMQDLSGGGTRFSSREAMEKGEKLLLVLRLVNERRDDTFYLAAQAIDSIRHPKDQELYIHRVKFLFRDLRDREKIVRFVFEEERRIRKKEVG